MGIYVASVSNGNLQWGQNMPGVNVAVIVGSNRQIRSSVSWRARHILAELRAMARVEAYVTFKSDLIDEKGILLGQKNLWATFGSGSLPRA